MMARHAAGRRLAVGVVAVWLAAALVGGVAISSDEPPADRFKGLSLAAALAKLQQGGLRVIFSSDLVLPEMTVSEEPRGRWPQEILSELLAPHGLRSQRGPSGAVLVVKAPSTGSIEGAVLEAGSRRAVPGIRIAAVGTAVETLSDAEGHFRAGPLPEGTYAVEVTGTGFLPRRLEAVPVTSGAVTEIRLELHTGRFSLEKVVVRASDPSSQSTEVRQMLGIEEIQGSPEPGTDPLALVGRLPGVATTEGLGAMNVRGGSGQELKIVLDGLELYEPYHLKERGGPISLIDSRNIGGIGLLAGAFPAEYGGHMSAIVEMDSIAPSEDIETGLAVSSSDAGIASDGLLGDSVGWLVSARRGDPSRFLDALGADPAYHPRYWDLFGKAGYQPGGDTTLSLNVLAGDDAVEGGDDALARTVEQPGTFRSLHTNRYLWLTLKRVWSPRLFSQTVVSGGRLTSDRHGSSLRAAQVEDSRSTELVGLRQDWLFNSSRHLWKWGFDAKRLRARYRYASVPAGAESSEASSAEPNPIGIVRAPEGHDLGVYVADRLRVSPKLSIEVGLRWELQTYASDRKGTLSPRLNATYALGERTTLRGGWGYFYQPQKIHQLQVEDGVEGFFPAERAEHRSLSFERDFIWGLQVRVEAYQKLMGDLRPRFENLFDPFGFFPEADGDRVRIAPDVARADGLELMVRFPPTKRTGGWAAYTLARGEDRVDGGWIPRSWDQRHALSAGFQFEPAEGWDLTLAGIYHSGRPTTPMTAETRQLPDGSTEIVPQVGARNSLRLPAYHRVDLRVGRAIPIRRTDLRGIVTITNLFDRENTCCVAGFGYAPQADGTVAVEPRRRPGLRRLLTVGLSWKF